MRHTFFCMLLCPVLFLTGCSDDPAEKKTAGTQQTDKTAAEMDAARKLGANFSDDGKTLNYVEFAVDTEFIIPHGVTTVAPYAFSQMPLTSVTIPASVTDIGEGIFSGCWKLEEIKLDPGNKNFQLGRHGSLVDVKKRIFLYLPVGISGEFTIDRDISVIGAGAFQDCADVSLNIPAGVRKIGKNAFRNGVKRIKLDAGNPYFKLDAKGGLIDIENKRLIYIPMDFSGHYNIAPGVESISNCFDGSRKKLHSVTFPPSVKFIPPDAISIYGGNLTEVYVPRTTTVAPGAFPSGCTVKFY